MAAPVPEGHDGRIVPYLLIDGAAAALDFYARAFGATELYRLPAPGGLIGHAEIRVHGALVYLADAPEDLPGLSSPTRLGGTGVLLHQYVEDCDAAVRRAVEAGATLLREPKDEFYGDRAATVQDPFGHQWSLHTHLRDVPVEELRAASTASES